MINKIFNSQFLIFNFANKQAGFTVLESMVAIVILSLSISGVFSAVQQGLSQSIIAKDEIKAFYLAQEAVEIIRNKRDNNQLYKIDNPGTTRTWLYGIAGDPSYPCDFNKVCRADIFNFSLTRCGDNWDSCPNLKQSGSIYLYGYDVSWLGTNFKREIKLEFINSDEIAVTVRIYWTKGLTTRDFTIKTLLFNWI